MKRNWVRCALMSGGPRGYGFNWTGEYAREMIAARFGGFIRDESMFTEDEWNELDIVATIGSIGKAKKLGLIN